MTQGTGGENSRDSSARLRRPGTESIRDLGRMMSKTRRIGIWAERIRAAYFSDPAKRLDIRKGEYILHQDHANDRLYHVLAGRFLCSVMVETSEGEKERLELFQSGVGGFIGVRSFFADTHLAVFDAIAMEDSVVAWIDRSVQPVETDRFGSLREQFFPVIMKELEHRQFRLTRAAKDRVSARIRMHKAEDMATLGQFAAGLAHELNNTTSVLMSSSGHLGRQLGEYIRHYAPDLYPWYERGMQPDRSLSSAEVREKARALAARFRLDYETAKDLVRMLGGGEVKKLPRDLDAIRDVWMTGRSCRDIVSASKHAANIIHSIKQLSTGGKRKREPVSIGESITEALELLRDTLKEVDIRVDIAPDLPAIEGNIGELMQMWLNIVRNAFEAMRDGGTAEPVVTISATAEGRDLAVRIGDNGPGIPEQVRHTLFQPSITTKGGRGNSMGLGLGLYIVKRLVESYHGRIEVENRQAGACFIVRLPVSGGGGDAPERAGRE